MEAKQGDPGQDGSDVSSGTRSICLRNYFGVGFRTGVNRTGSGSETVEYDVVSGGTNVS